MESQRLQLQWSHVDQTADPSHLARQLQAHADHKDYAPLLAAIDARLGDRILDVGCGTGGMTRALARQVGSDGQVIGVDNSQAFIAQANHDSQQENLPLDYRVGDAHQLPFADGQFDLCLALVTLEVVAQPRVVLHEMVRVTRPGGRLFILSEDVAALAMLATDHDVTRRIVHYISDVEMHGWFARDIVEHCLQLGLVDISITAHPRINLQFSAQNALFFRQLLVRAHEAGILSADEALSWLQDLVERSHTGRFYACQTYLRISAHKGGMTPLNETSTESQCKG